MVTQKRSRQEPLGEGGQGGPLWGGGFRVGGRMATVAELREAWSSERETGLHWAPRCQSRER